MFELPSRLAQNQRAGGAFCLGAEEIEIERVTLVSCQTHAQLPQHCLTFHDETQTILFSGFYKDLHKSICRKEYFHC